MKNDDAFIKLLGDSIIKNQSITAAKNFKFLLKKFEDFSHQTSKTPFSKRKLDEAVTPASKKVKTPYVSRHTDVFSFTKKNKSDKSENNQISNVNSEGRVWIKYKEGFSNAVKKQLTWDSFF